jgi:16S rRNA (cytidine1402-2'-O)-methyltransferase
MDIEKFMGQRIVSVCREMTKIHEEIFRGSLWKTINHFKNKKSIKGEIVILIAKAQYED